MKQMTIGKKLYTACGTMLAITLLLGAVAIRNVSTLGASIDTLAAHYTRILYLSGEIKSGSIDLVSIQRGILLRGHLKDLARAATLREKYKQSLDQDRKNINEILSGTKHQEVRDLIQSRILVDLDSMERVASEAYDAIQQGDLAKADSLNTGKLVPLGAELTKASVDLTTLEYQYANDYAKESSATVPTARYLTLLFIALSVAAGFFVVYLVSGIVKTLRDGITELRDGAEQVRNAASQVSSSSQSLAQGASEQAASLEETSASSEEITSISQRNTVNSRSTAEILMESQGKVDRANEHLVEMVTSMNEINESSGKISKIIKVIDEIAFQTNILALNAAVEAARAGEAGMGFAVVADEVRNLAQRSAQAAKDTASLIEDSIARSGEGKNKVDQVAHAIQTITEDTARIKTMVDEVLLGSEEQSKGVQQISQAIVQMEQVTQATAANAEESAAAAQQLNAQSETMKDIVSRLYGMVSSEGNERLPSAPHPSRIKLSSKPASVLANTRLRVTTKVAPTMKRSAVAPPTRSEEQAMEDSFMSF